MAPWRAPPVSVKGAPRRPASLVGVTPQTDEVLNEFKVQSSKFKVHPPSLPSSLRFDAAGQPSPRGYGPAGGSYGGQARLRREASARREVQQLPLAFELREALRAIPEERMDELPQALAVICFGDEEIPSLFFVPSLTRRCPPLGQEAKM